MKLELVLANLKREKEALDTKCEKIQTLLEDEKICDEVGDIQEDLLDQQLNAMSLYSFILEQRIADIEFKVAFKKHAEENCCKKEDECCKKEVDEDIDATLDKLMNDLREAFEDKNDDISGFKIEIKKL